MSDLIPISHEPVDYLNLVPEARIQKHAILRMRADQPVPDYRVGDEQFDAIARRTNAFIDRDARGPYLTLVWGTIRAFVYAGGVKIDDTAIETVERVTSDRERPFAFARPVGLESGAAMMERTSKPMSVEETAKLDEVRMELLSGALALMRASVGIAKLTAEEASVLSYAVVGLLRSYCDLAAVK